MMRECLAGPAEGSIFSRQLRLDRSGAILHGALVIRFIIQVSKGLVREQSARRSVMFFAVIAALVLLFLGATFLDRWLREHPLIFLIYWAACAWVTLLAVLLALFDLLMIRAAAAREKRELARRLREGRDLDGRDEGQ